MIILTLPYPISANRYWASRVIKQRATGKWMAMTYVTSEATEYCKEVARLAALQSVKPIAGRVALTVQLYPHRPLDWKTRQRKLGAAWEDGDGGKVPAVQCLDLDNANKVLLDALKGVAFGDDSWVRRLQSERMEPDERGARVVVTVEALAVDVPQADLLEAA
jgi:crossover junction endodeoxyribonuclease RusA